MRRLRRAVGWIPRLAAWWLWGWATLRAPYGHDLFEVNTVDNAMSTFSTLIPLFPLLFLVLAHDLARLIHRIQARRRLGKEAYERFVTELGREPDVPHLFSWPVRLALILLPFLLYWAMRSTAPETEDQVMPWIFGMFYSGVLGLWLLVADIRVSARYRG